MNLEEQIKQHRHIENLKNPYYVEGFNSERGGKCPYELDVDMNMKIIRIAMLERVLTKEEKERLRSLQETFDEMPWNAWTYGYYIKWDGVDYEH